MGDKEKNQNKTQKYMHTLATTSHQNSFSGHRHRLYWNCIGGMNAILPGDKWMLSSNVLWMVVECTVWHVTPKTPIGVHVSWDLVTVKAYAFIIFILILIKLLIELSHSLVNCGWGWVHPGTYYTHRDRNV